jgi:6-pyruvoyltetrahydropterin/6-carboxytetrahydropterin synthase
MLYRIKLSFDAAHYLPDYDGPCKNTHGHTWKIEFYIQVPTVLGRSGIGYDFKDLKEYLKETLPDHLFLNEQYSFVPSAENLVKEFFHLAKENLITFYNADLKVCRVVLWESETSGIEYDGE